jgi:hypothetical protein
VDGVTFIDLAMQRESKGFSGVQEPGFKTLTLLLTSCMCLDKFLNYRVSLMGVFGVGLGFLFLFFVFFFLLVCYRGGTG